MPGSSETVCEECWSTVVCFHQLWEHISAKSCTMLHQHLRHLQGLSVHQPPRRSYTREGFGEAGPGDGRSWKILGGSWRIIGRSGMLFMAGHAALRPSRLSAKGLGVETAERSAASLVLKFELGSNTFQNIPKPAAVKAWNCTIIYHFWWKSLHT